MSETPQSRMADLIASVPNADFSTRLLSYIQSSAKLENFGSFYTPDLKSLDMRLSIWGGKINDYRFRNAGRHLGENPAVRDDILAVIRNSPKSGRSAVKRWRPAPDDPRAPLYAQMGVCERITIASRSGRGGVYSFFLRSEKHGWTSDAEMAALTERIPMAHELIVLRHRIVGSEVFHYTADQTATSLRDRDLGHFGDLSVREAEVCDYLIKGLTAVGTANQIGIAPSSVRTLRRRAYRKLGISSATELMSLILHSRGAG